MLPAPAPPGDRSPPRKRNKVSKPATTIQSLGNDIMCMVFSFLGLFDLVRSSTVCKSWNAVIGRSKLLEALYMEKRGGRGFREGESLSSHLEALAMRHHRRSLISGTVVVDQWKGHSVGVGQCRMKMGLVLTGVGDKVMRLWSLQNYRCLEEYSISSTNPLVDFDFDESKIVGLLGTQLCVWRRSGQRSVFPSREGTFAKGLCMRYTDPEAVIGCKDGTARVFDMYSKKCTRIIRMHAEPATCLSLSDDQTIISGSALGRISLCCLSSDQEVTTMKRNLSPGIKTLCFNPLSHQLFAGTAAGFVFCWDLRMMKQLWETRVSPNVIYSVQHQRNDTSALVVGGIDGVLRILDQGSGTVLSSYVMVMERENISQASSSTRVVERRNARRLIDDTNLHQVPKSARPPITCLAVGMKKVVTTHNGKYIRTWKFDH